MAVVSTICFRCGPCLVRLGVVIPCSCRGRGWLVRDRAHHNNGSEIHPNGPCDGWGGCDWGIRTCVRRVFQTPSASRDPVAGCIDMIPKLRAERLSKSFPFKNKVTRVFEQFSASLNGGEVLSVLGPSGCGKTTLLRILAGLVRPDSVDCLLEIDGKPIVGPDPRVSIVFQSYALFPWRTVEANIAFGLEMSGRTEEDTKSMVDRMVEMVGLGEHRERYPESLSGGQQQRVAIARAFASEPELMLLDEPFAALDNDRREELRCEFLRWVRQLGLTAVVVTHDIREAILLGDQIVVLGGNPAQPKLSLSRGDLASFRSRIGEVLNSGCSGEVFETLGDNGEFRELYSKVRRALKRSVSTRAL
jgi:NitT/TauT family transport system ATP-binding protein